MSEKKEYLTLKEAQAEYGYSHMTLYRFRHQNKLTFYRIPGKRYTYLLRRELDELSKPQPKK